jgi:hypothetical protein
MSCAHVIDRKLGFSLIFSNECKMRGQAEEVVVIL